MVLVSGVCPKLESAQRTTNSRCDSSHLKSYFWLTAAFSLLHHVRRSPLISTVSKTLKICLKFEKKLIFSNFQISFTSGNQSEIAFSSCFAILLLMLLSVSTSFDLSLMNHVVAVKALARFQCQTCPPMT